jgi:hypothetical protein
MRLRRPERVAAAVMLTALVASVLLLGRPASGVETATPADNSATNQGVGSATVVDLGASIKATIRYGCSNGGWVEVTINAKAHDDDFDTEQVFQVGLAGTGTDGAEIFYAEGGPSQVVATDQPVTVRLAGPANEADHVFIKRVGSSDVKNIPLNEDCRNRKPTNFGLDDPSLAIGNAACSAGAKATLPIALRNPNELDWSTLRLGLTELDYTVLLVRSTDGKLMAPTNGRLVRFDGPGQHTVALTAPASKRTSYEVRVIGVDGSVVQSDELSVSCVLARPPTPTPTTKTPTPTTKTPSSTPSSTASAPPTTTPTSSVSAPPTRTPNPSASLSSSVSQSTAASPSAQLSSSTNSTQTATATTSRTRPSATASSAVVVPSEPSSSPSAPTTSSTPKLIAEPPANSKRIFVWQQDAALIVLLDAAAISMLVGATVWQAKRR